MARGFPQRNDASLNASETDSNLSGLIMHDLAHICVSCRTMTIFREAAAYPRRCGCCDAVIRQAPNSASFVGRPLFDDDDDDSFTLELGPASLDCSPF